MWGFYCLSERTFQDNIYKTHFFYAFDFVLLNCSLYEKTRVWIGYKFSSGNYSEVSMQRDTTKSVSVPLSNVMS